MWYPVIWCGGLAANAVMGTKAALGFPTAAQVRRYLSFFLCVWMRWDLSTVLIGREFVVCYKLHSLEFYYMHVFKWCIYQVFFNIVPELNYELELLAGCGWWLILIYYERKVFMTGWWMVDSVMLIWCEKKTLLIGWLTNQLNRVI